MAQFVRTITRRRPGLADVVIGTALFAALVAVTRLGAAMFAPLPTQGVNISLNPALLPYYAGRSLLRMLVALVASFVFTIVYGYAAAHSRNAARVLIPLLDVLQSVPVLGFLAVTVTGFMALFPGRLTGLELASIFAIFTGQAWNMAFAFYYSLMAIPADLVEAARLYRLSWWQRLTKLELPYSAIPLVWNAMMSFGGGWFFLAASESISVLNRNMRLPGLGSYMAVALEQGDIRAMIYAVITMAAVIVLVDQVMWRPLVAWAQKFRFEQSPGEVEPTSYVLALMRRSPLAAWLQGHLVEPVLGAFDRFMTRIAAAGTETRRPSPRQRWRRQAELLVKFAILLLLGAFVLRYAWLGALQVAALDWRTVVSVVGVGLLTLARVMAATLIGVAWTLPVGVAIGTNPRLAAVAQPLVQIAASFPANMLFPFMAWLYMRFGVNMNFGSILLMMLGTQWYILFNVIAGAAAIPGDLSETASIFKLGGWLKWKRLILPAVFPYLVTGCLTAAGGAWNASIVAEVVTWGNRTLLAKGLGAFITSATEQGNWPGIVWGLVVMSGLVVGLNRLLWRPLHNFADEMYRLG